MGSIKTYNGLDAVVFGKLFAFSPLKCYTLLSIEKMRKTQIVLNPLLESKAREKKFEAALLFNEF